MTFRKNDSSITEQPKKKQKIGDVSQNFIDACANHPINNPDSAAVVEEQHNKSLVRIPDCLKSDELVDNRLFQKESVAILKAYVDVFQSGDGIVSDKITNMGSPFLKDKTGYYSISKKYLNDKLHGPVDVTLLDSNVKTYLAQNIDTDAWVIVKDYTINSAESLKILQDEIAVLEKTGDLISHNVSNSYGAVYVVKKYYYGLDLSRLLKNEEKNKCPKLSLAERKKVAEGIADALITLHQNQKILHCDLKLNNIVFDALENKIYLIDFDLSLLHTNGIAYHENPRGNRIGLAPELQEPRMIDGKLRYTYNEQTEVFALGITLFAWFKLNKGFITTTANKLSTEQNSIVMTAGGSNFFAKTKDDELLAIEAFLNTMISKDPNQRPTLVAVKSFFASNTVADVQDVKHTSAQEIAYKPTYS